MSLALYPNRLWWDGLRGIARRNGGEPVVLLLPPHLPGLRIEKIDFAPYCFGMVMEPFYGWREMEAGEIKAAMALLARLVPC